MEASEAVNREIDRVLIKFDQLSKNLEELVSEILSNLEELKRSVDNGEISSDYEKHLASIKEICSLGSKHKDLHSSVSKVGKAIDRNFVSDFSSVLNEGSSSIMGTSDELNSVIVEHMLRNGMLDIANSLAEESRTGCSITQQQPFLELHEILESLKNHDLGPALSWVDAHRIELLHINSCLEFKLHRLRYLELLKLGSAEQKEALLYARHLSQFAHTHPTEIQKLMGSLLYIGKGLQESPYSQLLDNSNWREIRQIFTKEACCLLGLSVESALSVIIEAGCLALPPLLNIKHVMLQNQCTRVWSSKDELPVEIDLGHQFHYHSIFACPILRQQSTESNPPVRLVCGHVISRDALQKLSNGNKVKCPYCPVEQNPDDAREIYF